MSGQLATHTHIALAGFQVVDGADVVQAAAGHVVPRGGVCAGHDPRGAQRDGMDLDAGRQVHRLRNSSYCRFNSSPRGWPGRHSGDRAAS